MLGKTKSIDGSGPIFQKILVRPIFDPFLDINTNKNHSLVTKTSKTSETQGLFQLLVPKK